MRQLEELDNAIICARRDQLGPPPLRRPVHYSDVVDAAERQMDELSLDLQRTFLRVVQEALTNIYRHASASSISVAFRTAGPFLVLRIGDDGRGIARAYPKDRPKLGVGIRGMRTRLQQFEGQLKIKTGSWGTVLVASVPRHSAPARSGAWRTPARRAPAPPEAFSGL